MIYKDALKSHKRDLQWTVMTLYVISLQVEVFIAKDAGVYLWEHSPVKDEQILFALQHVICHIKRIICITVEQMQRQYRESQMVILWLNKETLIYLRKKFSLHLKVVYILDIEWFDWGVHSFLLPGLLYKVIAFHNTFLFLYFFFLQSRLFITIE